jgi:plastocyanin
MKFKVFAVAVAVAACAGFCPASFGQIAGKVTLSGKAPVMADIVMKAVPACDSQHPDPVQDETVTVDDKGNLANVVVSIQPEEGLPLPAGDAASMPPVTIHQQGCVYTPHAVGIEVGQAMQFVNLDPTNHNVHALAQVNPAFNQAQPNKNDILKVDPMKAPETFKVKCDVHPWMGAWVVVFEHPYFAVSGADGTYSINTKDLPDGDYSIVAWQEKYGKSDPVKITVKGGKADKAADFTFKAQ